MLTQRETAPPAMMDPLTGISDRRHLAEELENRIAEQRCHGIPFGCILINIDQFGVFSDTWGRRTGDDLLKMIAVILDGSTRGYDVVGRWSEEDFMAIVRNISLETLERVARRYLTKARARVLPDGKEGLSATLSIGAAMARLEDDAAAVVKRAYRLMYQSRADGGNRISCG